MNFEQISSITARPLAIRAIVPSLDATHVVMLYGESRPSWTASTLGLDAFTRAPGQLTHSGAIPDFSDTAFALDDGRVVTVYRSSTRVDARRYSRGSGAFALEQHWSVAGGISIDAESVLLGSGFELLVAGSDRDDGHGYSMVLTPYCTRTDLRTGACAGADAPKHLLPGAGTPALSASAHLGSSALEKIIGGLSFRREWALRLGPRRLLTTSRVIDVATGISCIGEATTDLRRQRLFDLSPDERFAVGVDARGALELWDVDAGTSVTMPATEHDTEIRCAVFVGPREIIAGTSRGTAIVVALT